VRETFPSVNLLSDPVTTDSAENSERFIAAAVNIVRPLCLSVGGGDVAHQDRQADAGFSALFRAEYARTTRTVFLVLHDRGHAEEIAQDAFMQLLDRWDTVAKYDQPGAWVRRVAIRMAVRHLRRERMRSLLERRTQVEPEPSEELTLPQTELLAAVRQLPTNQRVAVVLHYFEDRPIAEIADTLGCAPATARVHLHKARHRLADTLHEEVGDVVG
jgi:RNA polymerase sigma-70 factor (ECF subfamily)